MQEEDIKKIRGEKSDIFLLLREKKAAAGKVSKNNLFFSFSFLSVSINII